MRLITALLLALAILRSSDAESGSPSPSPTYLPIPKESSHVKSKDEGRKIEKSGAEAPVEIESCDAPWLATCRVDRDLVACLQHPKTDSKGLILLVQNKGENVLDVSIKVPAFVKIDSENVSLTKHGIKKINVSGDATNNVKIVLKSGNEDCVLEIVSSISGWNQLSQQYAAQLTPINGAYVMFATLAIVAGVWVCCKICRKGRRVDAGVPYQQLEMGAQAQKSSSAAVEASTADGWDQGWDDGWDEEGGGARPSSPNVSVPSNGLVSKSANKKNGWDIDWDD